MSRYSEAQFELVYAAIDDVAQARGYSRGEAERLNERVFRSDRLWDAEIWLPLYDFITERADELEAG